MNPLFSYGQFGNQIWQAKVLYILTNMSTMNCQVIMKNHVLMYELKTIKISKT